MIRGSKLRTRDLGIRSTAFMFSGFMDASLLKRLQGLGSGFEFSGAAFQMMGFEGSRLKTKGSIDSSGIFMICWT